MATTSETTRVLPIVGLDDEGALDRGLVGGKASSLARLMRAGLPVPPGFCLTVAAYEGGKLGPDLAGEVESHYQAICESNERCAVAVRSSAVAEDLPQASYAGQYHTALNVQGIDELIKAVEDCWASLESPPARAYGSGHPDGQGRRAMAVLVQRMVAAEVAGVAFSCDPVHGTDELTVEVARGLGEAVVSGRAQPQHLRLSRRGELIDAAAGKEPLLDEKAHCELAEMVGRVEVITGPPQDIEFALAGGKIWLLQSRPVTGPKTVEPLLAEGMAPRPGVRWTRAIADEYWADAVTPFSFSSLGAWIDRDTTKAIDRIMGFGEIDPARPTLRLFRSHAYWSADAIAAGVKYVPRQARTDKLLAYFPAEMRERVVNEPAAWAKRLRAELLMRLRDRNSAIRRNHRALEKHALVVDRTCAQLDDVDFSGATQADVERYWHTIDHLGQRHFAIIRWGMQLHSMSFNFLLARALQQWLGDDGRLFNDVAGSDRASLTMAANHEIWHLANMARAEPGIWELLEGLNPPQLQVGDNPDSPLYKKLQAQHGGSAFLKEFMGFLGRNGHRGVSRDIALPRWADCPDLVISLIAGMPEDMNDPAVMAEAERKRRSAAEAEIKAGLGRGLRALLRRHVIAYLLWGARTYTSFREDQRFTLDKVLLRARRAALAYGRLLAEHRLVQVPGDVFFLTLYEARKALDGEASGLAGLADARRRAYVIDSATLPPTYLRGDRPLIDASEDGGSEQAIRGMAVSSGCVTGRCRVIGGINEAGKLKGGELLVTCNIDPGWTPVLMKAGGLVLETGGVLSHGAILAREFGIPAVTAVERATARFADGEWLTVDGWAGTVEAHGEERPDGQS